MAAKNNPDILEMIKDYATKNPEQAKQILDQIKAKFLAKSKPGADPTNPQALSGL